MALPLNNHTHSGNEPKFKASVVIPTYNAGEILKPVLDALHGSKLFRV